MPDASTLEDMSPKLLKVVERAKREPEGRFHSLNWDGAFNDNERPKGLLCDRGGFRVSSSADKLCAAYSPPSLPCSMSWRTRRASRAWLSSSSTRTCLVTIAHRAGATAIRSSGAPSSCTTAPWTCPRRFATIVVRSRTQPLWATTTSHSETSARRRPLCPPTARNFCPGDLSPRPSNCANDRPSIHVAVLTQLVSLRQGCGAGSTRGGSGGGRARGAGRGGRRWHSATVREVDA